MEQCSIRLLQRRSLACYTPRARPVGRGRWRRVGVRRGAVLLKQGRKWHQKKPWSVLWCWATCAVQLGMSPLGQKQIFAPGAAGGTLKARNAGRMLTDVF